MDGSRARWSVCNVPNYLSADSIVTPWSRVGWWRKSPAEPIRYPTQGVVCLLQPQIRRAHASCRNLARSSNYVSVPIGQWYLGIAHPLEIPKQEIPNTWGFRPHSMVAISPGCCLEWQSWHHPDMGSHGWSPVSQMSCFQEPPRTKGNGYEPEITDPVTRRQ